MPPFRFRCPFCHTELGKEIKSPRCPACGRVMRLPPGILRRDPRERRARLDQIHRDAEKRRREAVGLRPPYLGNRLAILLPALAIMTVLGLLLALRSRRHVAGTATPTLDRIVADSELDVLGTAIQQYFRDTGKFPEPATGLPALIANPGLSGWEGPYITHLRHDPWGQPYRYALSNGFPAVWSAGRDRQNGTEDDLFADLE